METDLVKICILLVINLSVALIPASDVNVVIIFFIPMFLSSQPNVLIDGLMFNVAYQHLAGYLKPANIFLNCKNFWETIIIY